MGGAVATASNAASSVEVSLPLLTNHITGQNASIPELTQHHDPDLGQPRPASLKSMPSDDELPMSLILMPLNRIKALIIMSPKKVRHHGDTPSPNYR